MKVHDRLREVLLELADTLVDFELADFSYRVCERFVEILDVAAGIMVADPSGELQYLASSDENSRLIEVFQAQRDQGPCRDAYETGLATISADLATEHRWPQFTPRAIELGFGGAIAMPMRIAGEAIGSMNLFTYKPNVDVDLELAQALSDITALGIVNALRMDRAIEKAEQLQSALNTRVIIEQAKGVLAERADIDVDDAFAIMRRHARHHDKRIGRLAEDVVSGRVSIEELRR